MTRHQDSPTPAKQKHRRVSVGPWQGLIREGMEQSGILSLFESKRFPAPSFTGKTEPVATNIGRTFRITLPGQPERAFFAKSFVRARARGFEKLSFPKNAARSWKASLIMIEEGLPAPMPVCLMERRIMGMVVENVFINEAVPHTQGRNLEMYFRENFGQAPLTPAQLREKRLIIQMVAGVFRQAHAQDRIYFPDFHPHNMVYCKTPDGRAGIFLVDLDEVNFTVRKDDPIKNLTSLGRNADKINKKMKRNAITTGDRLRFLKAYLGPGNDSREKTKALWQEILDKWNLK